MATPAHASKVRSLYKRILVLHRFLPIELKTLGDQYVKDEFKRHKRATGGEVRSFMEEWEAYRDTLQTQVLDSAQRRSGQLSFGAPLTEEKLRLFQDQQVGQLYELMLESTRPNRQFNVQDSDPQTP